MQKWMNRKQKSDISRDHCHSHSREWQDCFSSRIACPRTGPTLSGNMKTKDLVLRETSKRESFCKIVLCGRYGTHSKCIHICEESYSTSIMEAEIQENLKTLFDLKHRKVEHRQHISCRNSSKLRWMKKMEILYLQYFLSIYDWLCYKSLIRTCKFLKYHCYFCLCRNNGWISPHLSNRQQGTGRSGHQQANR